MKTHRRTHSPAGAVYTGVVRRPNLRHDGGGSTAIIGDRPRPCERKVPAAQTGQPPGYLQSSFESSPPISMMVRTRGWRRDTDENWAMISFMKYSATRSEVRRQTVAIARAVLEEVSTFNEHHGDGRTLSELLSRQLFKTFYVLIPEFLPLKQFAPPVGVHLFGR